MRALRLTGLGLTEQLVEIERLLGWSNRDEPLDLPSLALETLFWKTWLSIAGGFAVIRPLPRRSCTCTWKRPLNRRPTVCR